MKLNIRQKRKPVRLLIAAAGLAYILTHLLSLSFHPFLHSDEAWLAVLSRAMMQEGSPGATEEVFRLSPRFPHALKTLYHFIQIPFFAISWSAVSARIPSLIAGFFALYLMVRIGEAMGFGSAIKFLPAGLMALDPQFWYLSHLARQEMILIVLFLWAWNTKLRGRPSYLAALPLAMAVFIHPNAFVLALPFGFWYLSDLLLPSPRNVVVRQSRLEVLRNALIFASVPAAAALLALGLSLLMDPDFLINYRRFGDSVGAGDSWLVKFLGLPGFLEKMIRRSSGTYYLADIRLGVLLGIVGYSGTVLISIVSFIRKTSFDFLSSETERNTVNVSGLRGLLLSIPALLVGTALVGKYGPPTIGFLMAPFYLCFAAFLSCLPEGGERSAGKILKTGIILVAVLGLGTVTSRELMESARRTSYRDYRSFLRDSVGGDGRVLANLNTAFAFDYNRLLIWRDLAQLPENDDTDSRALEKFLDESDVRWIVVPEELELIYASRPVWNSIYGNPRWHPELEEILSRRGVEVARGVFPDYAMRIVPFMDRKDWILRIYRIE